MAQTVDTEGRVPKAGAKATVIFLYMLALISVSLRTFIRLHYRKMQWLDDGCAIMAAVLMTVGLGLFFAMVDDLYIVELLIYDTLDAAPYLSDAINTAMRIQLYTMVYNIICITGIFAIKFSFLFFFRNLLSHIRGLLIYWRCVLAYTAFGWAFSAGFSTYGCPYLDERALQCAQGPTLWRAIHASVVLIVFDVSTDLLVISIPILILKRATLPLRKKLWLSATLCLSIVMIVVAILQAATLTWRGVEAIDVVWEIYFQFVELTLAIMVVSIISFRAFFVHSESRGRSSPRTPGSWTSQEKYRKKFNQMVTSTSTASSGKRDYDQSRDMPRVPPPSKNLPMRLPLVNIQPASDPTNSALSTQRKSDHYHSDAWEKGPMSARLEPPGNPDRSGSSMEYHRIHRSLSTRRQSRTHARESTVDRAGHSGSHEQVNGGSQRPEQDGQAPPSSLGVTPVSTSRSNTPPETDLLPPSPISPTVDRRSYMQMAPPPPVMTPSLPNTTPMLHTQRNDAPRHEALLAAEAPRQQNQEPLPMSPAPHQETEALRPNQSHRSSRRVTHIASLQRSSGPRRASQEQASNGQVQQPSEDRALPASPEPALGHSRRRSKASSDHRESGLKRAISNSLALASDFRAQRGEGV